MCEPVTIAAVSSIGISAAGAGVQAYGAHKESREQASADEEAARRFREEAERVAVDVEKRGAEQAGRVRTQGSQIIGAQRATFGAAGVDPGSGSAAALMADTRVMSELDAEKLKNNAWREAMGIRRQADEQARALRERAKVTRRQGDFAVAGSILGGIGAAAGQSYRLGMDKPWAKGG